MKKAKIVKNCNSSWLPWEEAAAPKGAADHSFGTTVLEQYLICNRFSQPTEWIGIDRT